MTEMLKEILSGHLKNTSCNTFGRREDNVKMNLTEGGCKHVSLETFTNTVWISLLHRVGTQFTDELPILQGTFRSVLLLLDSYRHEHEDVPLPHLNAELSAK